MQLPPADLHHLNAILAWRGELIVTGFGKKADQLWSSARDGFVVNINTGARLASGIEHPHSVINIGDDFAYCESRRMSVLTLSKDRSQFLPGYTRGLCLAGTKLYAGTSVGRAESKSTGVVNNPGDSGVAAGCCSVSRLSRESFQVEQTFNLDDYGREIYDLLPIDNVSEWRV